MNRTAAIKTLTHQEEIELLRQAKKGKTRQEREKATRLLVYYNRSFVKYLVGGYFYSQNEINSEDLVTEGSIGLVQAIREFDLSKAEKYRLASYASYWIHQRIRSFVKKNHFLPQATQKKPNFVEEKEDDLLGIEKKIPQENSRGVIYYDKSYHETEKDDKATSLLDTLTNDDEQKIDQQIEYEEIKLKANELISQLEYHEELIIRLFFGIAPVNLSQVDRLATEEKAKEIKKIKTKKKSTFFAEEKTPHLLEKYRVILAAPRKKEQVIQEFMQLEFWEYFREFPELALKTTSSQKTSTKKLVQTNQVVDFTEQKEKWKEPSEQQVSRWISLGYEPEDALDPQNQVLQKLGVSKKEKEQWKKTSSKTKNENWLEQRLAKVIDNRKKILLEKMKQIGEKK